MLKKKSYIKLRAEGGPQNVNNTLVESLWYINCNYSILNCATFEFKSIQVVENIFV